MSDTAHLAHTTDPDTSHDAAARATGREEVKAAILYILSHLGEFPTRAGLAAFEVQEEYMTDRAVRGWPLVQPHSIPRRMSELHMAGRIEDSGERVPTEWGRMAVVWRIPSAPA